MKYINTLIQLKNVSLMSFKNLICQLHEINDDLKVGIFQNDSLHYIQIDHYIAFKMNYYCNEYIYIYDGSRLYISVDLLTHSGFVNVLEYLYAHDLVLDFLLDTMNDEETIEYILHINDKPVIYLYDRYMLLKDELTQELNGLAYVVVGNNYIHDKLKEYYHLSLGVYLFFRNNECIRLHQYSLEAEDKFIERIIMKVKDYINQRSFSFPFSYNELYSYALKKIHKEEAQKEINILNDIERQLLDEEEIKEEYKEKINLLEDKINNLKYLNSTYSNNIDHLSSYPLLLKGDIEEFYQDEQKDMVLSILQDELDNEEEHHDIIEDILNQNKPGKKREELMNNIRNVLYNGKNSQFIEGLSKYGLYLTKGKTHYDGKFFNSSKYTITVASSSSDVNFIRQIWRQVEKYFF